MCGKQDLKISALCFARLKRFYCGKTPVGCEQIFYNFSIILIDLCFSKFYKSTGNNKS